MIDSNFEAQQKQLDQNELDKRNMTLRTICRDCVFAEFNAELTEQTGCYFNRLEKFKERNLIENKVDEETNLKYFEIQTFCNACRNSAWASKYEDLVEKVKKETQIQVDFILAPDTSKLEWKDEVINKTTEYVNQVIRPKKIVIVLHKYTKTVLDLTLELNKIVKDTKITFEIVNVIAEINENTKQLIDYAVDKSYSQYVTLLDCDKSIENNFIEKLNDLMNVKLRPFSLIEPTEGKHGTVIQTHLYKLIGGSLNLNIVDKIKEIAKNQKVPHMIINFQDI